MKTMRLKPGPFYDNGNIVGDLPKIVDINGKKFHAHECFEHDKENSPCSVPCEECRLPVPLVEFSCEP